MLRRLIIITLACILLAACKAPEPTRFTAEFFDVFDTHTLVIAYARDEETFQQLYLEPIRRRLLELHRLYDIYNAYEGLNNLHTINAQAGIAPVAVHRDLIDLLLLAHEAHDATRGAVNVALGPVLRLWHKARENNALPDFAALEQAALYTDIQNMFIDEANNTVFLTQTGMSLDVGAVAKAHALRLALEAVDGGVLINAGGNIAVKGTPAGRGYWRVGVRDPKGGATDRIDILRIYGATVNCSGAYERYHTVDGRRYGHIIDPWTLMPAEGFLQVTVVHENAGWADLLSTALFILPYEEGAQIADDLGLTVLWVLPDSSWRYAGNYDALSIALNP
jgi:thiamine biosynthesis lipoprotein